MSALAEKDVQTLAPAAGAMTGERYRKSLQDGREVWIDGERVADAVSYTHLDVYKRQVHNYPPDVMTMTCDYGSRQHK